MIVVVVVVFPSLGVFSQAAAGPRHVWGRWSLEQESKTETVINHRRPKEITPLILAVV